jgi:hypothetical protein
LPVGVECYAAYAARLAGHRARDQRLHPAFARWSAICSFALGTWPSGARRRGDDFGIELSGAASEVSPHLRGRVGHEGSLGCRVENRVGTAHCGVMGVRGDLAAVVGRRQIGSSPNRSMGSVMNRATSAAAGRGPPRRKLTLPRESRWPA